MKVQKESMKIMTDVYDPSCHVLHTGTLLTTDSDQGPVVPAPDLQCWYCRQT